MRAITTYSSTSIMNSSVAIISCNLFQTLIDSWMHVENLSFSLHFLSLFNFLFRDTLSRRFSECKSHHRKDIQKRTINKPDLLHFLAIIISMID